MKKCNRLTRQVLNAFIIVLLVGACFEQSFSAVVDEAEAIGIADMWYAMELNISSVKMEAVTKEEKLGKINNRQVLYMIKGGRLLDNEPVEESVLAYIIKYEPSGFVVVSGDDRMLPIVVFDATTAFRWDQPEHNFLRYFLQKNIQNRWQNRRSSKASSALTDPHPMWIYLRSKRAELVPTDSIMIDTPPDAPLTYILELDTAEWGQRWPYNTTVVANNGNLDVPTGCTATAMAIKMRYHSWPNTGNSSHSYTDSEDSVNFSHSVDFGAQSYNWSLMPTNILTAPNQQVADLMYHCGVGVEMNYELAGSGAWLTLTAMNTYFVYKGTIDRRSAHETPMIESILAGLPVILSSEDHTVVVDGYRDTKSPYFHINPGWSGSGSWYNLDQIPGGDPTVDRTYPYSSPSNYIFTDSTWYGDENGNLQNPYNTISEGYNATPSGGRLFIRGGTYVSFGNVPVMLSKSMTVSSYRGIVTIGN